MKLRTTSLLTAGLDLLTIYHIILYIILYCGGLYLLLHCLL
jgi:hypothetical protein